jgi:adenylate cyclase
VGYPDRARAELEAALASTADVDNVYTLAFALTFAGILDFWRGDWEEMREHNDRALSLASKEGFGYFAATSICLDGLALVHRGDRGAGLARMREGLDKLRSMDGRTSVRRVVGEYAEQLAIDGRANEGLGLVESEIEASRSDRFWDAELFRVKGDLLLMRGQGADRAEAERWHRRAFDVAGQQRARSFELRAAMSLARLLQAEGNPEQARSVLSATYGLFSEGFDTADLRTARELLNAL